MTSGLSPESCHRVYKYSRTLVLAPDKGTVHIWRGWMWGWAEDRGTAERWSSRHGPHNQPWGLSLPPIPVIPLQQHSALSSGHRHRADHAGFGPSPTFTGAFAAQNTGRCRHLQAAPLFQQLPFPQEIHQMLPSQAGLGRVFEQGRLWEAPCAEGTILCAPHIPRTISLFHSLPVL